MDNPKFKVIIVGGSIAGLTLAHGLARQGIDFIVLEKRPEVAPQEGASIGIMPNGGRILDQLGIFGAIEEQIEPLDIAHLYWPDGFFFGTKAPRIVNERFGFPLAFLERQKLLTILFGSLTEKSKVYFNKSVVSIEEHSDGHVGVRTADGCYYSGDLVVGADGVHSRVRAEMWRLADLQQPGLITEMEKKSMTVEYACTYGISSPVPGLKIGEHVTSLHDGLCIQSFPGKDGRVYWFIMEKLDRKYSYSEAPRYSSEDAANRCGQLKERKIWKDVKFGELWDKREVVSKTALEENVFQTWNFGPVVCIGDSMHKMAPNTGQGANCAIEDAACLLNLLKECYLEGCLRKPSRCELDTRLQQFTKMRVERITQVYKAARLLVRIHARDGLHMKLLGRYVIPYAGDVSADKASETVVGAPVLSFISPPKRCGPGWTSFQTRGLITMPIRGTAMILSLLVVGMTLYTLRVW